MFDKAYDTWKVRRFLKKRVCVKCDAGTLHLIQNHGVGYKDNGVHPKTGASKFGAMLYMWIYKTDKGTESLKRWCITHRAEVANMPGAEGPDKPTWNTLSEAQIKIATKVFKNCGLGVLVPTIMQKWSGLIPDDEVIKGIEPQFQVCGV